MAMALRVSCRISPHSEKGVFNAVNIVMRTLVDESPRLTLS
jgi:hypothetical protein